MIYIYSLREAEKEESRNESSGPICGMPKTQEGQNRRVSAERYCKSSIRLKFCDDALEVICMYFGYATLPELLLTSVFTYLICNYVSFSFQLYKELSCHIMHLKMQKKMDVI